MQTQKNRPTQKKASPAPFSDFEITKTTTLIGEEKSVSKGRFLFWGNVKSDNCPA